MKKILVIEDDHSVRWNTTEILKEEGFEVIEAENGLIGLELARRYLPDLILSDILMPELDGYGVLDELQKDIVTSSIPFIFLTARSENTEIKKGMKKGADDYITKPFKIKELLDAVNFRLSERKYVDLKLEELYNTIANSLPHELRTPLVAILGFSDFIRNYHESLESKEIVQMVEKIHSSGERLFKIIQKFLLYSELTALQTDKEQLLRTRACYLLNANQMVHADILKAGMSYGRTSDFKLNLAKADIAVSEGYFNHLITEIIENCIKFSKRNSPIEVYAFVKGSDYIMEFKDYGIGMSLSQVNSIGLFRQFDRMNYNQSGVGIGLALVKKILEIFNGSFWIESSSGQYTKVRISVPVYS